MKKLKVIALVMVPVLILGYVGVGEVRDRWAVRCAAAVEEVPEALPPLRYVPPSEVDLSVFDDQFRPAAEALLKAARHPASGLGPLRRAMVVEGNGGPGVDISVTGSEQDDLQLDFGPISLHNSPNPPSGAVARLNGSTGEVRWAREYSGTPNNAAHDYVRTPQGLAILQQGPGGRAPQLASFGAQGDLQWCTKFGERNVFGADAIVTMALQSSGQKLFALRAADEETSLADQRPTLTALDPANGEHRWEKLIDGLDGGGSVDSFQDLVLVSRWGERPSTDMRHRYLEKDGRLFTEHGALRAFAAADGSSRWEYRGPDSNDWAHMVIGVHDATAVVVSRRTPVPAPDKKFDPDRNQNWLIALGPDGREQWRQDLGNRIEFDLAGGVRLFGDLIVSFERGAKYGSQVLVGRDVKTGAVRWTTTADLDLWQGDSAVAAKTLFIRARDGLASVDLKTGTIGRPLGVVKTQRGPEYAPHVAELEQVISDEDSVTINADGLILTFGLPGQNR